MFGFLMKKAGFWFAGKQENQNAGNQAQHDETKIPLKLSDTIQLIKTETGGSTDIIIREIFIGIKQTIKGAVVFIDGMANVDIINNDVIKPLVLKALLEENVIRNKDSFVNYLIQSVLFVNEVELVENRYSATNGFLNGDVVLFIDGIDKAIIMNSKGWDKRSVSEPGSEAVVRGPRESFVENLRTNTSLIRRKIKNQRLIIESMVIGRKTRTNISIAYISGVARRDLISEVKRRLRGISTDSILETGYIEQLIEDAPGSIFATIGYTEKPDVAAAKMLEGRIAIIVDGTPFVLTVPLLFLESFQAAEDYYFRPYISTVTRIIRIIGYAITVLAPALYVAVTTYHQELIPTDLLITAAKAREGVPFPAFAECMIMVVLFEILREAGIRLPRPIGQALSIVGALVIGESAVAAGLIGAPMVIVVAITAVSGFLVPNQNDAAVIIRFFLLILSATFGGFGITMGMMVLLVHMSALESFGFPYLSPTVPFDLEGQKDTVVRAPLWTMLSRPKGMADDKQRMKYGVPPNGAGGGGASS